MKKVMIIAMICSLSLGAFAQRFHGGGSYRRSHVVLSVGAYAPYYPPYYGSYSPFYAPYDYPLYHRETRLERKIDNIKHDYQDRIRSARRDKTISRKERKQKVYELKHERDEAVIQAKRNYYK